MSRSTSFYGTKNHRNSNRVRTGGTLGGRKKRRGTKHDYSKITSLFWAGKETPRARDARLP